MWLAKDQKILAELAEETLLSGDIHGISLLDGMWKWGP
jgi:hypothetical protein